MAPMIKKKDKVHHVHMTVFTHLQFFMPTSYLTDVNIYFEPAHEKYLDRMIFIIGSRVEVSMEKDLNQLEMWKKASRCHVFKIPFDENIAESIKLSDLNKDGNY